MTPNSNSVVGFSPNRAAEVKRNFDRRASAYEYPLIALADGLPQGFAPAKANDDEKNQNKKGTLPIR